MNTKQLLKKIETEKPDIFGGIARLRAMYKNPNNSENGRVLLRCQIFGYCNALRDAGAVTETERRTIYCYITL